MRVVAQVRNNEGIIGELVISQVDWKVRERYQVLTLDRAAHHIGKIGKRIVTPHILATTAPEVAWRRHALRVGFPRFPMDQELAHHVVDVQASSRRHVTIVVGEDLSCGHHEIVAN